MSGTFSGVAGSGGVHGADVGGHCIFRGPSAAAVGHLLQDARLPSADLASVDLQAFFACGSPESPDGVVGLELHGRLALLRSLAVRRGRGSLGLGHALVEAAERHAWSHGVARIYLLTTTAGGLFQRLGYAHADRDAAPAVIRHTREFTALCPASAVLMVKRAPGKTSRPA
ncbi:MAG: arsenic resistance N-acetyltransferase ArsN2 [Betaproteobacteria bacterium]